MAKNIWREVYRDEAGRKQSRYVFSHCEHCRQRFWKKMPCRCETRQLVGFTSSRRCLPSESPGFLFALEAA